MLTASPRSLFPSRKPTLATSEHVENRAEVDALLAQSEEAGASLTGQPRDRSMA